jgi:hypothetical protein
MTRWSLELRDPGFALFLAAALVSLVRAPDQPDVGVSVAGTVVSLTPTDALLVALLAVVALRLARGARVSRGAWPILLTGLAFGGWVVLSSLPNGATAFVAAGKLVELGVLTLAAALLLDRVARLRALVTALVAMTVAAAGYAVFEFVQQTDRRQPSFLGEHGLATLSTLSIAVWLMTLVTGRRDLGRLPLAAGVSGALGITIGASFASLIGLYLAAGALLVLARARRSLRPRAALLTVLACVAITAGTLVIRSDNLGFLYQWLGRSEQAEPGAYAGSWSSRLIYAYVGGRVFLDNKVLGTGWYPELPPEEYVQYLPDARERFSDQPPRYFPQPDRTFIPQQTYDQVLYELGLVGAALLLLLAIAAIRSALAVGRGWARGDVNEYAGYVPLMWLLAIGGALAGSALFGGTPLAALFWLVLGVVAAGDRLLDGDPGREP